MRHSIIIKVGENLIYQQSPMEKPRPEISSTPVEYNRALPEWEKTATNCIIRPVDQKSFAEYIDKGGLLDGVKVPHEFVEIYEDGDSYPKKRYARMKGSPVIVKTPQTEVAPVVELEKYCEIYRDEKGEMFVKCKNVSMLEMETAKDEFLQKEKREQGQPREDAQALVDAFFKILPSLAFVDENNNNEKTANECALLCVKQLMSEDALVNPKRFEYLEKVKTEIKSL